MAIFGNKKDRDLPILTRVYQVDTYSVSELVDTVLAIGQFKGWERHLHNALPEINGSCLSSDSREKDNAQKQLRDKLTLIADSFRMTHRVMDDVYRTQSISQEDLKYLILDSGAEPPEQTYLRFMVGGLPNQQTTVTTSRVPLNPFSHDQPCLSPAAVGGIYGDPLESIRRLIDWETLALVRRSIEQSLREGKIDGLLLECQVCQSLYPPVRKTQIYCSHRCGHRIATRRLTSK